VRGCAGCTPSPARAAAAQAHAAKVDGRRARGKGAPEGDQLLVLLCSRSGPAPGCRRTASAPSCPDRPPAAWRAVPADGDVGQVGRTAHRSAVRGPRRGGAPTGKPETAPRRPTRLNRCAAAARSGFIAGEQCGAGPLGAPRLACRMQHAGHSKVTAGYSREFVRALYTQRELRQRHRSGLRAPGHLEYHRKRRRVSAAGASIFSPLNFLVVGCRPFSRDSSRCGRQTWRLG